MARRSYVGIACIREHEREQKKELISKVMVVQSEVVLIVPTTSECIKFKEIWLWQLGFECSHHQHIRESSAMVHIRGHGYVEKTEKIPTLQVDWKSKHP